MKYIKGDLFEGSWDAMVQVCNNYKTFGSGIAWHIANKYPEVYEADKATIDGDDKLGTFSSAEVNGVGVFYNLYAMFGLGNNGDPLNRNCSYDHLYNSLLLACEDLCFHNKSKIVEFGLEMTIGVPYLMGCDRAGGSWTVVEAILKDIEELYPLTFEIYVLESMIPKVRSQSTIPEGLKL